MGRVKLLHYCERWTGGGIENYILSLVRHINRERFEISILAAQKESEIYDRELRDLGVRVESLLERPEQNPIVRMSKAMARFAPAVKAGGCELLHLHICQGVALGYARLAKKAGVKTVIAHSHNSGFGDGNRAIKLAGHVLGRRLYAGYPDLCLACSSSAARWLFPERRLRETSICRYILDVESFSFSPRAREELRQKFGLESRRVLLHVGRMNSQKNQFFLLEAAREIFRLDPAAALVFIGTGELQGEIERRCHSLGLDRRVIFVPKTRDVQSYMSLADLFLLPSLFEGNPIAGVEAQASGLPCIFSDRITKEAKILPSAQFLPLELGPQRWAEAALRALDPPPSLPERMVALSAIKAAGYDLPRQVREMERIYLEGCGWAG